MTEFRLAMLLPFFTVNEVDLACKTCKKVWRHPETTQGFNWLLKHGQKHLQG